MALGWLWWRAWVSVDSVDAAAFGMAGVALGDMDLHFAWQAWHLVTWIVLLCLSFLPRHNFCTHTHTHTHTHTQLITTHNLSPHNVLTLTLPHTTCSTPILHHLFSLSCFPHAIFTLPFFCCLLEEIDMWGYPVL